MERFTHEGLTFDVLDAGPPAGSAVVLLHGFPQDATAWDQVASRLHAHGLRTLAPHQRGYSPGARPGRVSAYRMKHLVGDVLALLDAAGLEQAHVVGHDWGGAVAWSLAQHRPERVASLTVLSTPLPRALAWATRHGDQWRRSWYLLAFLAPVAPERILARQLGDGALLRQGVPDDHQQRYAARLGSPAALRGPLNWYRAALRPGGWRDPWHELDEPGVLSAEPVRVPTTLVWGRRDPYLGRDAVERTARHVEADYRFVELDAGHWLPEREPDAVATAVLARAGGPQT
nr:alpha/beta fold hydrolase [Ornithinimicrobium cavernae]